MAPAPRQLDIYNELCPASSATIIGAGLVSITMGAPAGGIACLVAGLAVGIAGPLTKTLQERRARKIEDIQNRISRSG